VIAATNHKELLDSAVWRRFSYRLALDFPTAELREKMWAAFGGTMDFTEREIALLVDLSEGFTGSDIREVYVRLRRRQLTKQQHPGLKDAFQVLQNMGIGEGEDRRFLSLLRSKDVQGIAASLRERNAKLYSHAALADLLGVSKATAHRWAAGTEMETNG
jgi:SpoVK/Ycf46/Vps4 family AAA+-type ATPase